jgi:hypothetical protein
MVAKTSGARRRPYSLQRREVHAVAPNRPPSSRLTGGIE